VKQGIHPNYVAAKVTCQGCGTTFETRSTLSEIKVEICSNCHPFYTGKQKIVDTEGRVHRFQRRVEKGRKIRGETEAPASEDEAAAPGEAVEASRA